jgi:4-hydroxybenzoyl-CoA thioesterase
MIFTRDKTLHFQHCDPAGIIFFPQYFVLFHEVLEDWFTFGLEQPYGEYVRLRRMGVPAVKADAEFLSQAWLGDTLRMELQVVRLGTSSLDYEVEAWREDTLCARGSSTVVQISLETRRPVAFTGDLRARIERYLPRAGM